MSCLFKILSTIYLMFWIETFQCTPLFQGFSIQKGFEVKLHPFEFKPLSIFKEKWSPFGKFGIRKGIQKRDLSPPSVLSPAPVFEEVNEGKPINEESEKNISIKKPELENLKPLSSNLIGIPLTKSNNPAVEARYTSINQDLSSNNIPKKSEQPIITEIYGELPPRPVGPIPEPAAIVPPQSVSPAPIQTFSPVIQPVSPVPIQPISPVFIQPVNRLPLPPVSPVPIQPVKPISIQPTGPVPMKPVGPVQPGNPISVQSGFIPEGIQSASQGLVPLVTPPPRLPVVPTTSLSEIPPTDGPLLRGSKLALYFGNVFLQLVSQFLTNARLQIKQLKSSSSPPPVFTNN